MFQQQLSHRLGPQDNSFLIYDTDTTPMNIGAVSEFEGQISYERFIDHIESKIHLVPRYRQVVVPTPFGVGRPTWEDDPSFDVRNHVHRLTLPHPATTDDLLTAASRIHETRLDRSRPLWEVYLVDGLKGGNTGMISKVHHCMVDGVGGMSLLLIILDPSPEAAASTQPVANYAPSPVPDPLTRITDVVFDALSEGLDTVAHAEQRILDVTTGAGGDWLRMMGASLRTALPYFLFPAARTPFNGPFSGTRSISGLSAQLDEVNRIRMVTGGTINDVVLAVLGGAIGRYLEGHGEDVSQRFVRVFTPVNVRRTHEKGSLGNHISMLVVEVPVGVKDPIARVGLIEARTAQLKRERVSEGVVALSDAVFAMPVPVSKALVGLGALPLDKMGNMVCTNVPGPQFPLYTIGHKMLSMYPIVPVGWEMGIGCAIVSYDQSVYLGLNADLGAAPDAHLMEKHLVESYVELRDAAGASPTSAGWESAEDAPVTPALEGQEPTSKGFVV